MDKSCFEERSDSVDMECLIAVTSCIRNCNHTNRGQPEKALNCHMDSCYSLPCHRAKFPEKKDKKEGSVVR